MAKRSAGLLLYRKTPGSIEVFLAHPGGPFWAGKDHGAWTIPKGEYERDEPPLAAARREFREETGFDEASFAGNGEFQPLGTITQRSGKIVSAWAVEGDCDPEKLTSNTCQVEWPLRSGTWIEIPEVDRGGWFTIAEARKRINKAQRDFLPRLMQLLADKG